MQVNKPFPLFTGEYPQACSCKVKGLTGGWRLRKGLHYPSNGWRLNSFAWSKRYR